MVADLKITTSITEHVSGIHAALLPVARKTMQIILTTKLSKAIGDTEAKTTN
jgi:hypothetical protein